MKRKVIWGIVSALVVVGLLVGLVACAKAPSPTAPTTPTAPTQPKTLKIGADMCLTWPLGVCAVNAINIDVDKINAAGGLDIGGEKYLIKIIYDDNKMDLAVTKTMAQKEIYDDQVKFMISDLWCDTIIPISEENKVLLVASPSTLPLFDLSNKYTWNGGIGHTNFVTIIPYIKHKFPELKTYVGALPDMASSVAYADLHQTAAENMGMEVLQMIYYPPTATDLSAVGTKIKVLNPDVLGPHNGGPAGDSAVVKAAYAAGWRGQVVGTATIPGSVTLGIAGADAAEGMMAIGWPMEMEPATNELAREFKADYIAEFGKWDDPEVILATNWWLLKAAFQQAGSIEPEKVRAVLDSGMQFNCPGGSGEMIPRPDYGISRTIQLVLGDIPIKLITGGQVEHVDTMTLQQAKDLVAEMYAF